MTYKRVRKSSEEAIQPLSVQNKSILSRIRGGSRHFLNSVKKGFKSLDSCPRELYINFVLKFCESYSYFALSQILVIYLHSEFGASDLEAGTAYGMWGLAITLFGLTFSWINDYLGVRGSLLIGFPLSAFATLIIASTTSKTVLYTALFGLLPLGNSMGIPMLTVGIRRYTNVHNRGFAFGLYYSVMNIAAFVSGPVVDAFNIGLSGGVIFFGRHWSGNRLVILTATFTSLCSFFITYFTLREVRVVDDASASTTASSSPHNNRISPIVSNVLLHSANSSSAPTSSDAGRAGGEIELKITSVGPGRRSHAAAMIPSGPHFTILGGDSDDEENGSVGDDENPGSIGDHGEKSLRESRNPLQVTVSSHTTAAASRGTSSFPPTTIGTTTNIINAVAQAARGVDLEPLSSDDDYRSCASDEESMTTKIRCTSSATTGGDNEIVLSGSVKLTVPLLASPPHVVHRVAKQQQQQEREEEVKDEGDGLISVEEDSNRRQLPRWASVGFDNDDDNARGDDAQLRSSLAGDDINNLTSSGTLVNNNNDDHVSRGGGGLQEFTPIKESLCAIMKEIFYSATFWRFTAFSLLLINLKTIFRHLDATLPTYLIRCFGADVPKGTIYSINPFMIIFLTPVVAAVTTEYAHFDMIKYGSYLTAVSPFFLAGSTSIWAACCMITVLTLGEAIWSPRTYDYTMSIAPEGKEASFAALSTAPLFAAKVPVGLMSGYLISTYLPEHGRKDGRTLWLIIGLMTLSSPISITLFEKWIREPEKPHDDHNNSNKQDDKSTLEEEEDEEEDVKIRDLEEART